MLVYKRVVIWGIVGQVQENLCQNEIPGTIVPPTSLFFIGLTIWICIWNICKDFMHWLAALLELSKFGLVLLAFLATKTSHSHPDPWTANMFWRSLECRIPAWWAVTQPILSGNKVWKTPVWMAIGQSLSHAASTSTSHEIWMGASA